jgi:hypothetical protein
MASSAMRLLGKVEVQPGKEMYGWGGSQPREIPGSSPKPLKDISGKGGGDLSTWVMV